MHRILTLSVVLTMALSSVLQAELMVEITRNPDPFVGLESFTVSIIGVNEDVSGVEGLVLIGNVHQVWPSNGNSPNIHNLTPPLWESSWSRFDTHLLVPEDVMLTSPNLAFNETNSGQDEVSASLIHPLGAALDPQVGLGTFAINDGGAFALDSTQMQTNRLDLLQVVLPVGEEVRLNVSAVGSDQSNPIVDFAGILIAETPDTAIPEPGTLTAICLLGGMMASGRRFMA